MLRNAVSTLWWPQPELEFESSDLKRWPLKVKSPAGSVHPMLATGRAPGGELRTQQCHLRKTTLTLDASRTPQCSVHSAVKLSDFEHGFHLCQSSHPGTASVCLPIANSFNTASKCPLCVGHCSAPVGELHLSTWRAPIELQAQTVLPPMATLKPCQCPSNGHFEAMPFGYLKLQVCSKRLQCPRRWPL